MKHTAMRWPVLAALLMGALLLGACGGGLPAGSLPPLAPTETAVPLATPTFPPLPTAAPLPEVNWEDTAIFQQAMRPEFADDVEAFTDRNRYYIEATLTLGDVVTLYGAERVRYTNRSADTLDEIVFRLYPNLTAFAGQMNVFDVMANGQPVTPVEEERRSVLRVPLPEPLAPGESAEVVLQFNSAIEGGFAASYGEYSYQRGVFAAPEWYPVLSVYEEGRGWWHTRAHSIQGEQTYTETGLYEIRLTADDDVTVIMSGREIDTVDNGDGTLTHHVVSGPMRDSILVASRTLIPVRGEVDGIALNVYYWDDPNNLERNARAAEAGLQIAADALRIFSRTFGPYPFNEFDVVQTNTSAGGIEYPGVIVVANNVWSAANDFFETVVAHEVAHQWWYSLVGNNQVAYPFIDESLTSFSEYVYYWETAATPRDEQYASDFIRRERSLYNNYVGQGNPDLPLGLSTDSYFGFQYTLIIYTKGPLFFNEITEMIGREEMYRVLQEYFRRYRYEVAEIGDMLAVFNEVTGQQWDQMFYEWVGSFPGLDPAAIATVDASQRGG